MEWLQRVIDCKEFTERCLVTMHWLQRAEHLALMAFLVTRDCATPQYNIFE